MVGPSQRRVSFGGRRFLLPRESDCSAAGLLFGQRAGLEEAPGRRRPKHVESNSRLRSVNQEVKLNFGLRSKTSIAPQIRRYFFNLHGTGAHLASFDSREQQPKDKCSHMCGNPHGYCQRPPCGPTSRPISLGCHPGGRSDSRNWRVFTEFASVQ